MFITFALGYLSLNTLLQCTFVFLMRDRLVRSLAMSRQSQNLSKLGLEGIYVLKEIERLTKIMEQIGESSDTFSTANIPTEDLEAILAGGERGRKVRKRLSESSIHAPLVNFLRSVEQGKKDLQNSRRGLENSRKLLAFLKQSTQFLPEAIQDAEESLAITQRMARISEASKEIALQSFQNAEKAYEKLKKHKKFFWRRRRFIEKQRKSHEP